MTRHSSQARPSEIDGAADVPTAETVANAVDLQAMSGAELRAALEANRPRKPVYITDPETFGTRRITTSDNLRGSTARCGRCGYFGEDRQFGMNPNRPSQLLCDQCVGGTGTQILERGETPRCSHCGQETTH